jgi:hypothetical protein
MSTVLQTEWQQILLDHPVAAQTVDTFRESERSRISMGVRVSCGKKVTEDETVA